MPFSEAKSFSSFALRRIVRYFNFFESPNVDVESRWKKK